MAAYMQPVIPEIAKAFENDPRTRLAQQAIATGTSTAPVAYGKYGWADGLARALQGVVGGYMNKQQLKKYKKEEDDLRAARAAMGQEGLTGLAAALGAPKPEVQPAPAPAQAPPAAAAIAPQSAPPLAQQPQGALPPAVMPQSAPPLAQQPPMDPAGAQLAALAGVDPRRNPKGSQGVAFLDPLGGRGRLTGKFGDARPGRLHNGLDLAAEHGSPAQAAADGIVLRAWNDTKNGGGNSVLVRHADGSITGYAHLASFSVKRGDAVQAGQPLGAVGDTGKTTGPHLHFTYRDASGKRVDPSTLKYGEPTAAPQAAAISQPAPDMPPEPALEAMPQAPDMGRATQSPQLGLAYRMLADGNRYDSDRAMSLMEKGLAEQGQYNENNASRKAEVGMTGYRAGLDRYGTSRQMRDQAAYDARGDARRNAYSVADREDQQSFQATQQERQFAHDMQRAGYDRETSLSLAKLNNDADWKRTQLQIDAAKGTAAEKTAAKRTAFFNTATGAKIMDESQKRVNGNWDALDQLATFETLNSKTSTGGAVLGNAPGLVTWANSDLQAMNAITEDMSIKLSGALKGAISDKEGERIKAALPSIGKSPKANAAGIKLVRRAINRANEFEQYRMESFADGTQVQFMQNWNRYRNDVSVDKDMTFDQYMKLPVVGRGR